MTIENISSHPLDVEVLESWRRYHARDGVAVLATLIGKDGSSPRPIGSQIAISARGEAVGYITGGCAEAAIAAEGVAALTQGASRVVRFGEGSRYADVRLPCGAGIDVAFSTDVDAVAVDAILASLSARAPCMLSFDSETGEFLKFGEAPSHAFRRHYTPNLRLDIVGKGPVVPALARLAEAARFEVQVASPEEETRQSLPPSIKQITSLGLPRDYRPSLDQWSAGVVLFHEHDWEPEVLKTLLASDAFYVGALGSRKTHADRCDLLRREIFCEKDIDRISGPIGLDIDAASPEEIAISILAEIVAASHRKGADGKWRP